MKKRMLSSFAVLAFMLALSSPSPAAGRHPQIERALMALQNAKEHLQAAAHDFGGHRAEAMRATDEAIHQLEVCLKYD